MNAQNHSKFLFFAAFAAIYLIWGSTYIAIKFAIETLPPFLMAGGRFLLAGAILYFWARIIQKEARPKLIHWRTSLVVGTLLLLGGNGLVVIAQHYIPSSLAALLVASEPLWIVLLNWKFAGGARPNFKVSLGLILGLVGVWLLIGGTLFAGGAANWSALFGAALVVGAAFCWASGSLYGIGAPSPASPVLASGMQMLAGGAVLTIVGSAAGEWTNLNVANVSLESIFALGYLVIFGSVIAFTAYSWLLKVASPAIVATYAYVNPVVAVILGWFLAGESLAGQTLIGAAVIVLSVILITSSSQKKSELAVCD